MYLKYLGGKNLDAWVELPNKRHQAIDEIVMRFEGDDGLRYTFSFQPGFTTDGGSIPLALRWFVPSWSKDNHVLNMAYALHDACYGGELLSRRAADDLLESMLYEAGLSRFRATTVKYAVANFASRHYGKQFDQYEDHLFVKLVKYK